MEAASKQEKGRIDANKIIRELDQRQTRIEWEQNRKRLEEEDRQNKLLKQLWAEDQQKDLQLAQQKQKLQYQRKQQDVYEQQELNKRNAEREIIKEENYKDFYRLCANNQTNLQKMHIEKVLQPLVQRQSQLEDMISKNFDSYQRTKLQNELDTVIRRQQGYNMALDANKNIIGEHNQMKQQVMEQKETMNRQRLDDLNNFQSYNKYKKQEQQNQQRQYRDYLDYQQEEREKMKLRYHQYGRPDLLIKPNEISPLQISQTIEQTPIQRNQSQIMQKSSTALNINERNTQGTRMSQFVGVGQNTLYAAHNPLTNPMPNNNQNPYIIRQQQQAIQGRLQTKNY